MKITREMVAARAGVCKQTVSCYFSGKRKVSPAAAERIERAIKELNYVPNMLARSLVMKETRTLAVICNDIANPNYSEIIGGIERAAQREGYTVAVYNAKNFSQRIVTDIISRRMDGVIVLISKRPSGRRISATLRKTASGWSSPILRASMPSAICSWSPIFPRESTAPSAAWRNWGIRRSPC